MSARPTARAGGSGRSSTLPATTRIRCFPASRRPRDTRSTSARATTTVSWRSSTSPSPGPRNPRRRSGTSRTASRRRSGKGAAAHYSGRETVARTLEPGRAGSPGRRGSQARPLPASRRRVFQLPARRRDAARRLAVRPALGRLEPQACVRGLQGGDRRGPQRRRRLRGGSSRLIGGHRPAVKRTDGVRPRKRG